jgi:hypothetical protein
MRIPVVWVRHLSFENPCTIFPRFDDGDSARGDLPECGEVLVEALIVVHGHQGSNVAVVGTLFA